MSDFVKLEDLLACPSGHPPSGIDPRRDSVLLADGWERRFTAEAQRIAEAAALYAQLGFEVRVEPLELNEVIDDCRACRLAAPEQFKTIYTQRKKV